MTEYLDGLQKTAATGQTVVHFAEQYPGEHRNAWKCDELPWYDGRANLSFATNDPEVAKVIKD
eukprot:12031306-Karenia_brevis.AAC.1